MNPHADLIAYLDASDLGPVSSVEFRIEIDAHQITLADSGHQGATARRWVDFMDAVDATAGRRRASDKGVRLNLCGFLPEHGPRIIVAIPFTNPRQVALIDDRIERQHLEDLTARLAELDAVAITDAITSKEN